MSTKIDSLAKGVLSGCRRALSQSLTLIESRNSDHNESAVKLLEHFYPHSGTAIRLGITGAPGVGKSTFIESLGNHLVDVGHRVAVLTIDPSSVYSGGSILGDKTRMEKLSRREEAFVRSSPSRNVLGGVTRSHRECLIVCEAAGYDVLLVETLGVGQSEVSITDITDAVILLLQPGAGDEIQGIKRGIVEIADFVIINKADDDQISLANKAKAHYENALSLMSSPKAAKKKVPVVTVSSRDGKGVMEVWKAIVDSYNDMKVSGELHQVRAKQALNWIWREVEELFILSLKDNESVKNYFSKLEVDIMSGELSTREASKELINIYIKDMNRKI